MRQARMRLWRGHAGPASGPGGIAEGHGGLAGGAAGALGPPGTGGTIFEAGAGLAGGMQPYSPRSAASNLDASLGDYEGLASIFEKSGAIYN